MGIGVQARQTSLKQRFCITVAVPGGLARGKTNP